ncbi:MAG: hypothetical protein ACREC6_10005 [Hyphomicrobiaceae bacterium]
MRLSIPVTLAVVIGTGILAALTPSSPAGAQPQKRPDVAAPAPSGAVPAVDKACNDFKNALAATALGAGTAAPERATQRLSQLASAGQLGVTCTKALAKHFENLRKDGGTGAWNEVEQEIDKVIEPYRAMIDNIEGSGGVLEEGERAVAVLGDTIKDLEKRRGKNHENTIRAQKAKDGIVAGLKRTNNVKSAVDSAIVDMQHRKSEIAEAHGIQRYEIAQMALEALNGGLEQVMKALHEQTKPQPGTKAGGG